HLGRRRASTRLEGDRVERTRPSRQRARIRCLPVPPARGRRRTDPQAGAPQVMSELDSGLRRVLGPISAISVVVGAIVGAGIFFTPTLVARMAGDADLAMWTWIAGGGVAMF